MLSSASGDAGSFHVAANPQLAGNSRPGSNGETRTLVPGFTALNSQTIQWDSWHLSDGTASGPSVYLYDGSNIMEEIDPSGNGLARYTQGGLIDEPFSVRRAGTTSYYQTDGLGSITSLSNSTGALVNTYSYDSYGELIGSVGRSQTRSSIRPENLIRKLEPTSIARVTTTRPLGDSFRKTPLGSALARTSIRIPRTIQ